MQVRVSLPGDLRDLKAARAAGKDDTVTARRADITPLLWRQPVSGTASRAIDGHSHIANPRHRVLPHQSAGRWTSNLGHAVKNVTTDRQRWKQAANLHGDEAEE